MKFLFCISSSTTTKQLWCWNCDRKMSISIAMILKTKQNKAAKSQSTNDGMPLEFARQKNAKSHIKRCWFVKWSLSRLLFLSPVFACWPAEKFHTMFSFCDGNSFSSMCMYFSFFRRSINLNFSQSLFTYVSVYEHQCRQLSPKIFALPEPYTHTHAHTCKCEPQHRFFHSRLIQIQFMLMNGHKQCL